MRETEFFLLCLHKNQAGYILYNSFDLRSLCMKEHLKQQKRIKKATLPFVELQFKDRNKNFEFEHIPSKKIDNVLFKNHYAEIKGKWNFVKGLGYVLNLCIRNIHSSPIRVKKIFFPVENKIGFEIDNQCRFSFFHNGFHSWSKASIELQKHGFLIPFSGSRKLASEMFTVVCNLENKESAFIGQGIPFNQFISIFFNFKRGAFIKLYFSAVFNFGRKIINPGEEIQLDEIILSKGNAVELLRQYGMYIQRKMKLKETVKNITGWSSWNAFKERITPDLVYKNLRAIKEHQVPLEYVLIEEGYQKYIGDWLELTKAFDGRMKELTQAIKEAGYKSAIWIAPFIADRNSRLLSLYPEFILKDKQNRPIPAGKNPLRDKSNCVCLDVSLPLFQDYITNVIQTFTKAWGFSLLKLDFIYGACMNTGLNTNLRLSFPELLKEGLRVIREAAGKNTVLLGNGAPLSASVGKVMAIHVSADTAHYWSHFWDSAGIKNSLRNILTRSVLNKKLWLVDPDSVVLYAHKKLRIREKMMDLNAKIITGGGLFFSDDFYSLSEEEWPIIYKIINLSEKCFRGETFALDFMEGEFPHIYYNTAGYLCFFNSGNTTKVLTFDLKQYGTYTQSIHGLKDVWTEEEILIPRTKILVLLDMKPYFSRLFKILP